MFDIKPVLIWQPIFQLKLTGFFSVPDTDIIASSERFKMWIAPGERYMMGFALALQIIS